MKKEDEELLERLKDVFDSLIPEDSFGAYPDEAMPTGTLARSIKHDRLGVVVDAFYGDVDKTGKKIIVYTLLLTPERRMASKSSLIKE